MLDGFQLDPHTVLGLDREATPEQVREAYRAKSKKYHPDLGGDEWAFRIVTRAYELLGEGRDLAPAFPGPFTGGPAVPPSAHDTGQVRPGIHDRAIDSWKIVAVEIIWMRYEVEDVVQFLSVPPEARNLSGTIHLQWPNPLGPAPPHSASEKATLLLDLQKTVELVKQKTKVRSAQVVSDVERFEAWLSYPSGSIAWEAFRSLHIGLKLKGLGVQQWTRDLTVPRPET